MHHLISVLSPNRRRDVKRGEQLETVLKPDCIQLRFRIEITRFSIILYHLVQDRTRERLQYKINNFLIISCYHAQGGE